LLNNDEPDLRRTALAAAATAFLALGGLAAGAKQKKRRQSGAKAGAIESR
jgi:hypothetical protein